MIAVAGKQTARANHGPLFKNLGEHGFYPVCEPEMPTIVNNKLRSMKKHYTSLLSLLIASVPALAQTLNQGNTAPVIGDQFTLHVADYIAPGAAGSGQTWNLAGINSLASGNLTYVSVASTANGASYPQATLAAEQDGYAAYFKVTSGGLENAGVQLPTADMVYSNPEMLLKFPSSMGTNWNDPWSTTYTISGITISRSGTVAGSVDGTGTLVMPYGSVPNVVRVKVEENYSDATQGSTFASYVSTNYYYYKAGIHSPLAQISEVTTTTNGSSQTSQGGKWLEGSQVGIQELLSNAIGVDLYPNPAKSNSTMVFTSNGGSHSVDLLDASGHVVRQEELMVQPGISRHELDLHGLQSGLYMVRITAKDGSQGVQRLVVE